MKACSEASHFTWREDSEAAGPCLALPVVELRLSLVIVLGNPGVELLSAADNATGITSVNGEREVGQHQGGEKSLFRYDSVSTIRRDTYRVAICR